MIKFQKSNKTDLRSRFEPRQRAHSPLLAAGLASEQEIDYHPYGVAQHCRYRQHIPRGLPRGGFNHYKEKAFFPLNG